MNEARRREATDRLLALRPADLDGWERIATPHAAEERADQHLADVLDVWFTDVRQPTIGGAAIRRIGSGLGAHRTRLGLVAAGVLLMLSGAAALYTRGEGEDPVRLRGEAETSHLSLEFSVEREAAGRTTLIPGMRGGEYGRGDAIALRIELRGQPGWLVVVEVDADGVITALPTSPESLAPGVHTLSGGDGLPAVWRPETEAAGTLRYVAFVTDEPVDALRVAQGLVPALDRPDLWPRPVRTADVVELRWSPR